MLITGGFMINTPFHIKLLLSEMQIRKQTNPRYSLRAFSKFLGMGPSTLSRILTNNQELSLAASKTIIKKMKFNRSDSLLFISSVAEEKKLRAIRLLTNSLDESISERTFSSYDWMLSNSPDLVFVLDRSGRCILANDLVSRFFNINTNNIMGRSISEMGLPVNIAEKLTPLLMETFEIPRVMQVEECYKAKNDTHCFEITLVPIIGHSSEVRAIACHWRDITVKTHLEQLLRTQSECGEILVKHQDHHFGIEEFLKSVTESFCDACIVHFIEEDKFQRGGDNNLIANFEELYPMTFNNESYRSVLKTGQAQKFCHLDEASLNIFNKLPLGLGSFICVPFTILDGHHGSLTFLRSNDHTSFGNNHILMAKDLGLRIASAIERSVLLERCK
jgi:PAS domain S-box-containing protein